MTNVRHDERSRRSRRRRSSAKLAARPDRPVREAGDRGGTPMIRRMLAAAAVSLAAGPALAQSADMTFFVSSTGSGKGADFGGLEGADRHCQTLAEAAGVRGKTWRAYLST